MKLNLYTNSSDNSVVNKSLSNVKTYEINLKDACSVTTPTVLIATDDNLSSFNYARIETFSRYYYINDIKSVRNGLWELSLKCDVLMSFKNQFLNLDAVIERQENEWNLYLNDGAFKILQKDRLQTKAFPKGFTSGNFLLTVAG